MMTTARDIGLGVLLAAAAGCAEHEPPPVTSAAVVDDDPRELDADGPFPPTRLVIHPLTQIYASPDTGQAVLELHIDLRDAHAHQVKSLGELVVELYEDRGLGRGAGARQLERWTVDLRNPDFNAVPFDRVTRTYQFELIGLPEGTESVSALLVAAQWSTVGGRELAAQYRFSR
ncbi:MAG: hypothetical protein AAGI30_08755 [Planctomycetota bacterium]